MLCLLHGTANGIANGIANRSAHSGTDGSTDGGTDDGTDAAERTVGRTELERADGGSRSTRRSRRLGIGRSERQRRSQPGFFQLGWRVCWNISVHDARRLVQRTERSLRGHRPRESRRETANRRAAQSRHARGRSQPHRLQSSEFPRLVFLKCVRFLASYTSIVSVRAPLDRLERARRRSRLSTVDAARRDRTDRQNFTRRARPPLPRAPSTNASIVRSTPRSTSVPSRRRSPRRASKVNLTVIIVIASR